MPQLRNLYGKLESPLPSESPISVNSKNNFTIPGEGRTGDDTQCSRENRKLSSLMHEQSWAQLMQEVHALDTNMSTSDRGRKPHLIPTIKPDSEAGQLARRTHRHTSEQLPHASWSEFPMERGDNVVQSTKAKSQSDVTRSPSVHSDASWYEHSPHSSSLARGGTTAQKIRTRHQSDLNCSSSGSWNEPNPAPAPRRHPSCTAGVRQAMAEAMRSAFFRR